MKLLEPRKFDAHKNATVPMIAMLGCSEINMEILNIDIEFTESDDCKEISRDNGDVNSMLAMMQEEARFSHKDGQNFINLFI